MLRLLALAGAVVFATLVWTGGVGAQATATTTSFHEPISAVLFIECADGGAGETVLLSGTVHVLLHSTMDGAGGFHAKIHVQPHGVRGVGETTGAVYHGTGVTQEQFNGRLGTTFTFVNNFRIIGQGSGNNFLAHSTIHISTNAAGEVKAEVENISLDCR